MIEILAELEKRSTLAKAIDTILQTKLERKEKAKVKRGKIHNLCGDVLDIRLSNPFCILINERMDKLGYRRYKAQGRVYYKNVKLKD